MNTLKYKLIIAEGNLGLMLDLEKFWKEHPEAIIEVATHGTTYRPKIELISEQIMHYYTIFYREK